MGFVVIVNQAVFVCIVLASSVVCIVYSVEAIKTGPPFLIFVWLHSLISLSTLTDSHSTDYKDIFHDL